MWIFDDLLKLLLRFLVAACLPIMLFLETPVGILDFHLVDESENRIVDYFLNLESRYIFSVDEGGQISLDLLHSSLAQRDAALYDMERVGSFIADIRLEHLPLQFLLLVIKLFQYARFFLFYLFRAQFADLLCKLLSALLHLGGIFKILLNCFLFAH